MTMGKTAEKIDGEVIEDVEVEKDELLDEDEELNEDESENDEDESEDGESDEDESEDGESESSEDVDAETDEVIVTIGEEAPPSDETDKAPDWVKELRKNHRETSRENKELKQKLKQLEEGGEKPQPLGPKPKLEDFDYDTDKYERELESWHSKKREKEQAESEAAAAERQQEEAWQQQLNSHAQKKSELKVKDYDEAEAEVLDRFDVTQQGIIVQGSENSALVMYALGKNPKKMQELSSITDPVKFAFAVAKLEAQLKVTSRKAPPPPEKKPANGTGSKSGVVDSTLERLRAKAAKTGDYTEVAKYKKQKRQQAKK